MSRSARIWSGIAGACGAVIACVVLLGWATAGFAVLTTDAARALRVKNAPVPVPAVAVRDSRGNVHAVLHDVHAVTGVETVADLAVRRPRAVIVDFVYTRCLTVCGVLGGTYQRLQRVITERALQDKVRLLTVSFDQARDDPSRLASFARMHGADAGIWSLATPVDALGREQLLRTFGVQVVPDGQGGWVHNAALHVVDPSGRLVRIVDIGDTEGALAHAVAAWESAP